MNWSDVGSAIADAAPLLGSALGGPAGGAVGSLVASVFGSSDKPDDVAAAIKADPQSAVKLKQIQADHQDNLAQIAMQRAVSLAQEDTKRLQAVNATMQTEAKSEHWPQWSWRPFNGYMFGSTLFGVYFLLPILQRPVPSIPEWVWMAWAAVLGVTAWHRGKKKRIEAGETSGGIAGALGAIVSKAKAHE